jgi:hypothetical protein
MAIFRNTCPATRNRLWMVAKEINFNIVIKV